MAAWRGHIGSVFYFLHSDGSTFFFLTTLVPFFVLIIYVSFVVRGLTKYAYLNRIEFNWTVNYFAFINSFYSYCILDFNVSEYYLYF